MDRHRAPKSGTEKAWTSGGMWFIENGKGEVSDPKHAYQRLSFLYWQQCRAALS